jgi:hypothetical protein
MTVTIASRAREFQDAECRRRGDEVRVGQATNIV